MGKLTTDKLTKTRALIVRYKTNPNQRNFDQIMYLQDKFFAQ